MDPNSNLQHSNHILTAKSSGSIPPAPGLDIFPTPSNNHFQDLGIYQQLDAPHQEIRLIRLSLNLHQHGIIQCQFLPSVPLSVTKGQYSAISYCAGDPRNTVRILVNGAYFNVFANLAHALEITRQFWLKTCPDKDCILWADQICINQFDLAERSHQVGFMRGIYSSASMTLVCLSTHADGPIPDTRGVEWLDSFYEIYRSHPNPPDNLYLDRLRDPEFFQEARKVINVFNSPWWTRAWVLQEFISSPDVRFLYGSASIHWTHVSELIPIMSKTTWLLNFPTLSTTPLPPDSEQWTSAQKFPIWNFHCARFLTTSKASYRLSDPPTLLEVLKQARPLASTDKRDKVYAFLGLAKHDYGIVPDYNFGNSVRDVYIDVAGRFVLQDKNLDLLSVALNSAFKTLSLPSWVQIGRQRAYPPRRER